MEREVRWLDLAGYAVVLGIGVLLLGYAIAMVVPAIKTYGWTMEMLPRYVFLGAIGFVGLVTTCVGLKWIIEGCVNKCHYAKIREP